MNRSRAAWSPGRLRRLLTSWPIPIPAAEGPAAPRALKWPGGYSASRTNQLITNLKKKLSTKGTPPWSYKLAAIQQVATAIRELALGVPVIGFALARRVIDRSAQAMCFTDLTHE